MSDCPLLPIPFGRRVRIAHNENAFEGQGAKAFIRSRRLAREFVNVAELSKSIEFNSVWTIEVTPFDSSASRTFAAHSFPRLLQTYRPGVAEGEFSELELTPLFPHHDGLILECVREDSGEMWTMIWREGIARFRYQLRSSSLRSLLVRALEICVGTSSAKLETFELGSIVH